MKIFYMFIILCFCTNALYCQIPIKKFVCDSQTHEGVPFVTIKVLNKPLGTWSDEMGWFNLPLQINDSLLVTCVGYYSKVVNADNDSIFLNQHVIVIDEIDVHPHKNKECILGYANSKSEKAPIPFITNGKKASFTEMVSLIEIPDNFKLYKINGILMMVENPNGKPLARLHIYKPDSNGLPGEEILTEDIIINYHIKRNKIDLSHLQLFSTERNLFVGFEFLVTDLQKFAGISKNAIKFCFTNSLIKNFTYVRTILSEKYTWRPIFTRSAENHVTPNNLMVSLIIE